MERLLRLEKWLDRSLTRLFARTFRSPVDPVEIAAALRRECDDKASHIGSGRTLVPNEFAVELAPEDFKQIDVDSLQRSLIFSLDSYAVEREYSFAGPITIAIAPRPEVESGLFALRSTSLAVVPKVVAGSLQGPIWLEVGTRKIVLEPGVFRIGRDDSMDLRLEDPGVSRHHCDIEINGSTITVHDHNSTNGTLVDGSAVTSATLVHRSVVRIGGTDLIVHIEATS